MFATTIFPPAMLRVSSALYVLAQKFLMVAGLVCAWPLRTVATSELVVPRSMPTASLC